MADEEKLTNLLAINLKLRAASTNWPESI
jgi:hypothetical protein